MVVDSKNSDDIKKEQAVAATTTNLYEQNRPGTPLPPGTTSQYEANRPGTSQSRPNPEYLKNFPAIQQRQFKEAIQSQGINPETPNKGIFITPQSGSHYPNVINARKQLVREYQYNQAVKLGEAGVTGKQLFNYYQSGVPITVDTTTTTPTGALVYTQDQRVSDESKKFMTEHGNELGPGARVTGILTNPSSLSVSDIEQMAFQRSFSNSLAAKDFARWSSWEKSGLGMQNLGAMKLASYRSQGFKFKNVPGELFAHAEIVGGRVVEAIYGGAKGILYTPEELLVIGGVVAPKVFRPTPEEKILKSQSLSYGVDLLFKGVTLYTGLNEGAGVKGGLTKGVSKTMGIIGLSSLGTGFLMSHDKQSFARQASKGLVTYGVIGMAGYGLGSLDRPVIQVLESKQMVGSYPEDINKINAGFIGEQEVVAKYPQSKKVVNVGLINTRVTGKVTGSAGGFETESLFTPNKAGLKIGLKESSIPGVIEQTYVNGEPNRQTGVMF